MVTNPRLNNARRNTTNNTCMDHFQPDKKLIWNKHTENTFTIIHQNICSLLNKKEELLNSLIGHDINRNLPANYLYDRTSPT